MLYKSFYLSFLRSFMVRFMPLDLLSSTFFDTLITIVNNGTNNSLIMLLLSFSIVRNSFISFMSGRYSSRIFFFLLRSRSTTTVSFFIWLLTRYHLIYINILFRSIKSDLFYYLIAISRRSMPRHVSVTLLSFSNLFISKLRFITSFISLKAQSFTMHSFFHRHARTSFMQNVLCFNFVYFPNIIRFFPSLLYLRKMLFNLTYQIEHSLFPYSNVTYLFAARFYYNKYLPPITSAKIVCEYIIQALSFGYKLPRVFSMLLL
jgi:hypothetical protein